MGVLAFFAGVLVFVIWMALSISILWPDEGWKAFWRDLTKDLKW